MIKLLFFLFLLLLPSCSPNVENKKLVISSWNTYCFFDGVENSTEYPSFSQTKGYTRAKYEKRIKSYVHYISTVLSDSDIIFLEEIESNNVLIDLLEGGLSGMGYLYYGLAQERVGELSVGFISRIKPSSYSLHKTTSSRYILELSFFYNNEMITVLALHFKSQLTNSNGIERMEEAKLVASIIEEKDGENIVVIGDFNCDVFSNKGEMGDERDSSNVAIKLTGDGRRAYDGVMFTPYLDYAKPIEKGSYYYLGAWYSYDNALLSSTFFDGKGIEYDSFRIVNSSLCSDSAGLPLKYDISSESGFSDHFAISLYCNYN